MVLEAILFFSSSFTEGMKKGEDIPLSARIFALVDVYDAITSDRPYQAASTAERALEFIHSMSGKHFDPKIVEVFLSLNL